MKPYHSVSETDSERQAFTASQEAESLPSLPRSWSQVCHETGLFLRGIGLGIVVTSFQGFFTDFSEPKKVAIRQNRFTALLRTIIHAVPVGIAVFEIVLNVKGRFVGPTFDKQNYLQFAAKAHEIAMQASMTTILLSYIRYQISVGKGMPFGAVLGGSQIPQVGYLWSMELWSSILSKDFQLRKKISFTLLILICITVAAAAGPSSASLLIARQGLWPTASTYLVVNASVLDIWPDRLDKEIEQDCAIVRLDALQNAPRCPISALYTESLLDPDGESLKTSPLIHSIPDDGFEYPRYFVGSSCPMSSSHQSCGTIPQFQLLAGFNSIQNKYMEESDTDGYQFLQKNYYQPYTVASCMVDVVKDASDPAPLRFPRIAETHSEFQKPREMVSVPGLTKGEIIKNMSSDNSEFHVTWIDLPVDLFNTGIPGAVIVNSQDPNGLSYNITACTLNAGWGSSTISSSTAMFGDIFSYMSNTPSFWPINTVVFDPFGHLFMSWPYFANLSNFSYPQRRISVSRNWMEFLNPTIIQTNNSTGKYISLRLSSLKSQSTETSQPTEGAVAQLLNMLLAVALADTESEYDWKVFDDLENATRTCNACLVFEVEYSFLGWLYSASGTTTKLAMTIMLAYCTLVLGHIIYSATYGVSSTAWDSTAELVALAMNSSPTKILQNTCAGIIGRQALKTPVRVLVTTPGHLELVFGEVKDSNAHTLEMNEKYGKLMDEDDDEEHEEPESKAQGTLRKRAMNQRSK